MIGILGMGLLGSNLVRAALRRGEQVNVWSRNAEKARALEADGARAFADPVKAVQGLRRIHLALSDDDAVEAVLAQIGGGLAADAVIVDHTTTSVAGAQARSARYANGGPVFQHAPVFMGPQDALASTGVMLVSGNPALLEQLRPELEKMTGRLVDLGSQSGRAAAFKLLGNQFFLTMTAGVGEMLALAKAFRIEAMDAAQLFDIFNPGLFLPAWAAHVAGPPLTSPSWELQMARKDARLMLEATQNTQVSLPVLSAVGETMDRFIARGHAQDDWTVFARP
jgi:3-hydroxyisobutyrate dehydrogenase